LVSSDDSKTKAWSQQLRIEQIHNVTHESRLHNGNLLDACLGNSFADLHCHRVKWSSMGGVPLYIKTL